MARRDLGSGDGHPQTPTAPPERGRRSWPCVTPAYLRGAVRRRRFGHRRAGLGSERDGDRALAPLAATDRLEVSVPLRLLLGQRRRRVDDGVVKARDRVREARRHAELDGDALRVLDDPCLDRHRDAERARRGAAGEVQRQQALAAVVFGQVEMALLRRVGWIRARAGEVVDAAAADLGTGRAWAIAARRVDLGRRALGEQPAVLLQSVELDAVSDLDRRALTALLTHLVIELECDRHGLLLRSGLGR